ncbi:MAG: 2OG-Fe(II) oxygenase [Oleibacter sp.]|nr:2OG-Fe(II) oxygenase [Thalassolituus sp.]
MNPSVQDTLVDSANLLLKINRDDTWLDQLSDDLRQKGFSIIDHALPEIDAITLKNHLLSLRQAQVLRAAAIGRGENINQDSDIRRDNIHWLSPSIAETVGVIERPQHADDLWINAMESLRSTLNQRLFLGLFSYESHYAWYAPGAFYKTHMDAFRGESNRVLSTVFYLNDDWQPEDEGHLMIYDNAEQPLAKVAPEFNRLVVFLSEEFPHEVLPATRDRLSIAGWFRLNANIGQRLDPPA